MDLATAITLYRKYCEEVGLRYREPHRNFVDRESYWYFADPEPIIGRSGILLRKSDGLITEVGSGLGMNREIVFWAYEQGILTGKCNLIITDCGPDPDAVIDVLTKIPPAQRGLKLPRPGREKWRQALSVTPVVIFSDADLTSYVPELWQARQDSIFSFEIQPVA